MSSAINAARTASVPDDNPIACGTLSCAHNSRSRPSTSGPPMNRWLSQTRVTASRMAWRSGVYCAWRSSSGTVTNISWYCGGRSSATERSARGSVFSRGGGTVQPQFRRSERQSYHDSRNDIALRDRDASPTTDIDAASDVDRTVSGEQQHEQQTGSEIEGEHRRRMPTHESPRFGDGTGRRHTRRQRQPNPRVVR